MEAICGAHCDECELLKNNYCKGCNNTEGCPFGKKCWIAQYIELGGKESFVKFQEQLIEEFNSLKIDGMPKINNLYPLHGSFVNLEYLLPNGKKTKILVDNEAYLGTQVEVEFNDGGSKNYFGLLGNMDFLLVCTYDENRENAEIVLLKKR